MQAERTTDAFLRPALEKDAGYCSSSGLDLSPHTPAALAFLSTVKKLTQDEADGYFASARTADDSGEETGFDCLCAGLLVEEIDLRIIARRNLCSNGEASIDLELIEAAAPPVILGGLNSAREVYGVRRGGGRKEGRTAEQPLSCSHCYNVLSPLLSTPCQGGCKTASFCNKGCQKKHWKSHKKICKKLQKVPHRQGIPKRFTVASLQGSTAAAEKMLVMHSRTMSSLKEKLKMKTVASGEVLSLLVFALFRGESFANGGKPPLSNMQLCVKTGDGADDDATLQPLTQEILAVCRLSRGGARSIPLSNGLNVLRTEGSPMHIYTGPSTLCR